MKHRFTIPLLIAFVASVLSGCDGDDEPVAVPIAPVIMNVVFPAANKVAPGGVIEIAGKGFSKYDQVRIEGFDDAFDVEVVEVTTNYIKIRLPREAGGPYSVVVTRDGKTSTLDGSLLVPYSVALENVVLPATLVQQEAEVSITGTGFEDGDIILLTGDFYPDQKSFEVPATLEGGGIRFALPKGVFGVNTLTVTRGNRQTILGTISVEAKVGDLVGGGIVYWVDGSKAHGLIAALENVGTATEPFGPEVAIENASGTEQSLGSGRANTSKIVAKMASLRTTFGWPEWQNTKIAAELCNEYVVNEDGFQYDDWYLPSREELIELFKAKGVLADHGHPIPANNYWTSSEAPGTNAGWSAYYVNFYETENIISDIVSKSGWLIGVRPVRSF